jgi:hypothetical protein
VAHFIDSLPFVLVPTPHGHSFFFLFFFSFSNPSHVVDAPTPAESLVIGAVAKQQMQIEQRQQQEQLRKHQHLQQQQQEEAERQAELLNQELWKQKQEEMEQRMQKQKEKEEKKKEQERQERLQKEKEQHERDRKEQELKEHREQEMREEREERERAEKERLEKSQLEGERLERERIKEELEKQREEKERKEKEQREKEEQEQEKRRKQEEREREQERERKEKEAQLAYSQPILSLGSCSFNPDASLTLFPPAGEDDRHVLGSKAAGPFGLDTFATFSTLSLAPTHYTGSFNPFSMDDMPLMRRSLVPSSPFFKDNDVPLSGRNRLVVPPIPGKPRQTSRFGFAVDNHHSESLGRDDSDPTRSILSVQDGFRTPFPNTNMSFEPFRSPSNQHPQHSPLQRQQLHQARFQTSPSTPRQGTDTNMGMWDSGDKLDGLAYMRNVHQLIPDTMTTPTSLLTEHHQALSIQQLQLQRCGPPGLVRNPATPTTIKSPPPGLESFSRNDYSLSMSQQTLQEQQSQQQRRQQHQELQPLQQMYQHQTLRPDNWTSDSTMDVHGTGSRGNSAHDFFGAFLKAAASQASQSNPTEDTSGM